MNISSYKASSLSDFEEKILEANDPFEFQASKVEEDLSDQGSGVKENVRCNFEWKDSKEEDLLICQTSKGVSDEYESMESTRYILIQINICSQFKAYTKIKKLSCVSV